MTITRIISYIITCDTCGIRISGPVVASCEEQALDKIKEWGWNFSKLHGFMCGSCHSHNPKVG